MDGHQGRGSLAVLASPNGHLMNENGDPAFFYLFIFFPLQIPLVFSSYICWIINSVQSFPKLISRMAWSLLYLSDVHAYSFLGKI